MNKKQHIVVFGGSFNPIHNGHIAVAKAMTKHTLCDEVWLMVSPQNPLKEEKALLPTHLRLLLAQKAVEGEKDIKVSDFELSLPQPSYTYTTLQALQKEYPEKDFSILIGADNWHLFKHWAHWKYILQNHRIFVYPRNGYLLKDLPKGVEEISAPLFNISSTIIRKSIKEGTDISTWVPQVVNMWATKEKY